MMKTKASAILNATKPFVMVRALVQLALTLLMLAVAAIAVGIILALGDRAPLISFIIALVLVGGIIGLLRFAKRYCLYMIKAAHIAAITEYIHTGAAPTNASGYNGVLSYGKEVIQQHFVTANVAFAADALVEGATRQIMRWLNKAQNFLSFIPGSKAVFHFVNFTLSTALKFVDEAVLSYVFFKKEESNAIKKACDGVVYYAQSWKGMLKGAIKVAAFVWIVRAVMFVLFSILDGAVVGNFYLNLVIAYVLMYGVETAVAEPFATCVMINDYYAAIEGQPLKTDLHQTLINVSSKFKALWQKNTENVPS